MTLLYKKVNYKILFQWIFIIMVVIETTPSLFAGPITFNTAMPVTEGVGILRIQSIYSQSTRDPSPQDRELNVLAFPIVGVYGLTRDLAVFGIIPILDKKLDVNTSTGRETRGDNGLGDITFIARYTAWERDRPGQLIRIAPFAGIKMPTGEDNKKDSLGRLPQPLQLGSGSWDPSLGVVATWATLWMEIDTSASYKFNTEANNFRFGDVAQLDLSYQHRVWPRTLDMGVPAFVYGVLESNLIWQDQNEVSRMEDKDSGGITWFLGPGIQFVTKRLVVEAAVQFPVLQDLNGDALKNDFTGILSLRVNF